MKYLAIIVLVGSLFSVCATSSAGPVTVAVVGGEKPTPAVKKIETLLTAELAKQKGVTLVDRETMEKVLSERTEGNPLRAAGVLICLGQETSRESSKETGILVWAEAVHAQTGGSLGKAYWSLGPDGSLPKTLPGELQTLWTRAMKRRKDRSVIRSVEIAPVALKSDAVRLGWMADDLTAALRAVVGQEHGVYLLIPRQPISTREERLLRVAGLSQADPADKAAGLRATPDMRIQATLHEKPAPGVPFNMTPLTITLKRSGDDKRLSFEGTVGSYDALRGKVVTGLAKWLSDSMPNGTRNESLIREMVADELKTINQLQKLYESMSGRKAFADYFDGAAASRLLSDIHHRALRVSHLDPTNEEAAYAVAVTARSPYQLAGKGKTQACWMRQAVEARRYLQRFAKHPNFKKHELAVLVQLVSLYNPMCELRAPVVGRWYTSKKKRLAYQYALYAVPAMARRDVMGLKRPGRHQLWVTVHIAAETIFLLAPTLEELEIHHDWWKSFWKDNVESTKRDDVPEWDYVSLAYHARKGDVKSLRQALVRLSKKNPHVYEGLWKWAKFAPRYLRIAGDPEWNTWKPSVTTTDPFHASVDDWIALQKEIFPGLRNRLPLGSPTELPVAQKLTVNSKIVEHGNKARHNLQGCVQIVDGNDTWTLLISPNVSEYSVQNPHFETHLHLYRTDALEKATHLDPSRVGWPTHPLDNHQTDNPRKPIVLSSSALTGSGKTTTLWAGTCSHGLARFDRTGDTWTGQWLDPKQGIAEEHIYAIALCRYKKRDALLIAAGHGGGGRPIRAYILDTETQSVTVVGGKPASCVWFWSLLRVQLADGTWPTLLPGPFSKTSQTEIDGIQQFLTPRAGWLRGMKAENDRLLAVGRDAVVYQAIPKQKKLLAVTRDKVSFGYLFYDWSLFERTVPRSNRRIDFHWPVSKAPSFHRPDAIGCGDGVGFWGIEKGQLLYCQPPGAGQSASDILWAGPFTLPGKNYARQITPGRNGHLWVATYGGTLFRFDPRQAIKGHTRTSAQWEADREKEMSKAEWKTRVAWLCGMKRFDAAIKVLDSREAGPVERVYRGMVRMRQKKYAQAAAIYKTVMDDPSARPALRALARANRNQCLRQIKPS